MVRMSASPKSVGMDALLRGCVARVASTWPSPGGDPNVFDILWLAERLQEWVGDSISGPLVGPKVAIQWVEDVDRFLVKMEILRRLDNWEVAERTVALKCGLRAPALPGRNARMIRLIQALYTWFGAIGMAKSTRVAYNSGPNQTTPYSQEERWIGYYLVQLQWKRLLAAGNPWVRFGVSIANALAKSRGDKIIDRWVPKASPYWGLR